MNYKKRMLEELLDLNEKIYKLNTFINANKTRNIELLEKQLNVMVEYSEILKERLENELN